MQVRLLDDVMDLGDRGAALLCMTEDAPELRAGMRLADARGREHAIAGVTVQDGVCTLHLPHGEAAYFERLFRDVRIDATLFTVVEDAPCP